MHHNDKNLIEQIIDQVVLANIIFANMFALVGAIFLVATLLPHTLARSGSVRAECLIALVWIRRAILPKRLYSIRAGLQFQIDARIGDFVAWRSVLRD